MAVYGVYDYVKEGDDQKKGIRFFVKNKVHPRRQNPGYAYAEAACRVGLGYPLKMKLLAAGYRYTISM